MNIYKDNTGYSVVCEDGYRLPINVINFPKCIEKLGEKGTIIKVGHYISTGKFKSSTNDILQNEIKLAIGDKRIGRDIQ